MTLSPQAQAIYDNLIETEYKKPFSEEDSFAALVAAMGEVQKTRYELPEFVTKAVAVREEALSDDAANVMSRTPVSKAVIENIIGMTTKAYNDSLIKPGEASVNGAYQKDALLIYSDKEVSDAGPKVVQEINDMDQGKEVDHTPLSPGDLRKFSADEVRKLADSYRALLNNKAAIYLPSHYMSDIAYPIIDKYCAGDISADNAAREIDNAIRKYISEQN